MLKQLASSIIGLIVLTTLVILGVNIVFSYPYFEYYGVHTATLDLLNNVITPEELRKTNIQGYFLTWSEIKHLQDVAELVSYARFAIIGLVPLSIVLMFKWESMRVSITIKAALWTLFLSSSVGIAYSIGGARMISGFIHPILFPQGNWMFDNLSLIRRIYGKQLMENGASFILAFTIVSIVILAILVMWRNHKEL